MKYRLIGILSACHICILILSNVLVQYPFQCLGFTTTCGALTYPFVFILTDLTARFLNARLARCVVFCSMLPGLLISYGVASVIALPHPSVLSDLFTLHIMPFRIAIASFLAYGIGQLFDLSVFQRYRTTGNWWFAPLVSSLVGDLVDTFLFFAVAFYHCSNPILSEQWLNIACVDLCFKIVISVFGLVPVYGIFLPVARRFGLSQQSRSL
jgi:uncharacterized integral membrane protein (TIGR00697 family)